MAWWIAILFCFRPLAGINASLTKRILVVLAVVATSFRPLAGINASLTATEQCHLDKVGTVSVPLRGLMPL